MTSAQLPEFYICVDVETSGPIPGEYSLLSIGACTIYDPQATFYIEIKPINQNTTQGAQDIHKLSLERLSAEGADPVNAMQSFETWLSIQVSPGRMPIFVAFNAPFDWMFINYYFHRYLGHNPFGHAALDIKALYMGWAGVPWSRTSWRVISPEFVEDKHLTHHALEDALDQAALFKRILTAATKPDHSTGR